ncbi:TonB-dependent receptor [Sphingomonas sp. BT-65]|uniref:TonB-dependent receptor n=1 Tax=Sphingomonas sp. BT-65 TaxID=2989821 RepID=UPI0022354411|nr:TonB-dependent receptor [Sphingomonas sp. BT-65]MCW4462088.1 TonB-dependent receptor [Sphingomonas sp. BT-65]
MGKPANAERSARARRAWLMGSAALSLLAATQAMAQDQAPPAEAAPADEEEIVISGIRETIQTSIATKRNETAIVDALSSDDIGDLPALSVGQAIQTITGATTHREKGDASEIALRGLGPFLSNSTFNGREATNGSGDRSVNYNQFPSELINEIKIYKSQQADLIEGGVAGTIELGTLRPLSVNGRRIQAELKGNFSPYGDRIVGSGGLGYRVTASYVDQFDLGGLGRLGISLGYQRNEGSNPEETVAGSSTWTACSPTVVANGTCTEVTRAQALAGAPFYLVPNSMAWRQISEDDKRDAFFGAIQWQPSDRFELNIDVQYSDRTFVENRRDLNISEMRFGLTNVVFDENHVLRSFNGLSALESTASELSRSEEYLGGGAQIKWQPIDRLTLTADASFSRTIRTEIERNARLRTDPFDVNNTRNFFATAPFGTSSMRVPYSFSLPEGEFVPRVTIDPRFNLNNHNLFWDDARMRRDESRRHNEIIAGRFDARYEFGGFLDALSVGGRISELTFNDYDDRKEFNLNPAMTEDRRINNLCRVRAFPQTNFLKAAEGNTITSWATFDPDCLFREYTGSVDPGRNADTRAVANRDVTERVYAGYIMGEYRGDLGSLPVRGNFGVRVVRTEVTSVGLRSDLDVVTNPDGSIRLVESGDFTNVVIENATTRALPSLNAIFDLKDDLLLRAAVYRAMSRPAPSSLGAGRSIVLESGTSFTSIEDAIRNITANGSPRLEPLMSWNGDLALEWYPNRDTLLSGTVYYKQFSGGFIPVVIDEQFTIGGQQITVPVTQTQNSDDKSRIWGLEVTAAHRLSWLPKPLDGLGFKVSYNYADSDFKTHDIRLGDVVDAVTGDITPGIIPPANISGYSKHVLSAQAYYEIGPLSVQGIYNYRSNYYQDFVGGNTQLRYVEDNETFDLRATLNLMKNVSLRFEAINIFDEPKATYMPVQGSSRQYHYYGPRYFIGARVRL